jgi:membrane protease YdiL (CAAX protease family)
MHTQNPDKQRNISIIIFFVMTYAFSWTLWIPMALSSQNKLPIQISPFLGIIIGGMGPSISAIILILAELGTPGIGILLKRLIKWRVAIQWYLFIFFIPAVIIVIAIIFYSLFEKVPLNIPNIGDWRIVILMTLLTFIIGGPIGEELGWRGYALPKLLETRSPLLASIILGVGWGMWHLPLFWIPGSLQADIPPFWFMISIIAESILYTWIYNNSGGSLLLMVLFHTSINTWAKLLLFPAITNSILPIIFTFILETVIALVIIPKLGIRSSGNLT